MICNILGKMCEKIRFPFFVHILLLYAVLSVSMQPVWRTVAIWIVNRKKPVLSLFWWALGRAIAIVYLSTEDQLILLLFIFLKMKVFKFVIMSN